MSTNYATQFDSVIAKTSSLEEALRKAQAALEKFKSEQQSALHEQVMKNIIMFFEKCVGVRLSEANVELNCSVSHVHFWVEHPEVNEHTPRVYSKGTWEIPSFEGSLERFQETIGHSLQREWERWESAHEGDYEDYI